MVDPQSSLATALRLDRQFQKVKSSTHDLVSVALDNDACSGTDVYEVPQLDHAARPWLLFRAREGEQRISDALLQALFEVEQRIPHLSRHYQLRIKKWILCLTQPISNNTWKRCRNQYCQLLLYQLVDKGRLTEPFNCEPKPGPLQNLPANALAEWQLSQRSISRWRGQTGCAS
jgi:hypothetical protein